MSALFRYKPQVESALTQAFLGGGDLPNVERYAEVLDLGSMGDESAVSVDLELVRDLLKTALEQELEEGELDAWLAHRLHYALRLPRRIAADRWFWAWLALNVGRDFVRARFKAPKNGRVSMWRFTGIWDRNALSRLWWGAEMVRNGSDYSMVPRAMGRVRTAQWVLELRYSWYRPAAIAFTRVAEVLPDKPLDDDVMKGLSKKINAYLSLSVLEELGADEDGDEEFDVEWRRSQPTLKETLGDKLVGPNDGRASKNAIAALETWFTSLLKAA